MSTRDKIINAVDTVLEDNKFCEKMAQEYLDDPDPEKDNGKSIEEYAQELGIELT